MKLGGGCWFGTFSFHVRCIVQVSNKLVHNSNDVIYTTVEAIVQFAIKHNSSHSSLFTLKLNQQNEKTKFGTVWNWVQLDTLNQLSLIL